MTKFYICTPDKQIHEIDSDYWELNGGGVYFIKRVECGETRNVAVFTSYEWIKDANQHDREVK